MRFGSFGNRHYRGLRPGGRLVAAAGMALVAGCAADMEVAKLVPSDSMDNDNFGYAVSISGDLAVAGVLRDDDDGIDAGAAYVFRRSATNWIQEAKLNPVGNGAEDNFGSAVAIDGDTIVVGAPRDNSARSDSGAAYVFRRSGTSWSQQTKLTATDAAALDNFGRSVGIAGDTIVVGADHDDDTGSSSGSTYVFQRSGTSWSQQAKLTANDAAAGARFGFAVAISGNTVVVGALEDDAGQTDTGSAYVFQRAGGSWVQQALLTADDAAPNNHLGWSVSISGDTVLLGRNTSSFTGGSGPGAGYVFTRNGTAWSQQQKLAPATLAVDDFFGFSVAANAGTILVGAWNDDGAGNNVGTAYVFARDGVVWDVQAKLTASGAAAEDMFAIAVAVSGDSAVVGAHRDDNQFDGLDSGSAYVFQRRGSSWSEQAKLTANSADESDKFGEAVAMDGTTIAVGATNDDELASNAGAAYVYVWNGSSWVEQAKLIASDGGAVDLFGNALAIAGDTIVAGAQGDDDHGMESGSAYVFQRSGTTWSQQAKLTASDGASGDSFGFSVAIGGDRIVVGAVASGPAAFGSAYIFERTGAAWAQTAKLTPSDGTSDHFFGWAVDVAGDRVVVGAPGDGHAGPSAGSAYVFEAAAGGWTERCKLTAFDADASYIFGAAVASEGSTIIIGAPADDVEGTRSGSAFNFELGTIDCLESQRRLIGSDTKAGDALGSSVAISGSSILVGATGAGAACVFEDR